MLIGREAERGFLADRLAAARGGRGQVVVVEGEPGIGKTALLDDAAARAGGMTVLRCTGVESEIEVPYGGLRQLLDGAGLADDFAGSSTATLGAAGAALLAAWRLLAARRPLLVVADDLHWLDGPSVRALLFAARRIAADPVAVFLARRDLDDGDAVARAGLPTLRVCGLTGQAVHDLLEDRALPRHVVELLAERAGGNPLALLELATGEVEQLSMSKTIPLADRLRDAFTDRLRGLPEPTRRALVVAAADDIGLRDVVFGAVARLGLGLEVLAAAEDARLLVVGVEQLRFRHPLMRSAVYHGAPYTQRIAAHEALGAELAGHDPARAAWHRALAATGPDEQRAKALAEHAAGLRNAGGLAASSAAHQRAAQLTRSPGRRRDYLVTAAYDAWKAGDSVRARSLAAEATAIASSEPDVVLDRLRGYMEWYAGDQAIAAARLAASADHDRTAPDESATALLAACDAAWQAGEVATVRSLTDRLGKDPAYGRIARLMAAAIDDRLSPADAVAEAIPAHHPSDDPRRGLMLMFAASRGPDLTAARDLGLRVTDRLRSEGMFSLLTVALSRLADVEYQLGRWEEGAAHAEEGLRHADDAEHRARQADFSSYLALFAAVRGDAEGTRHHSRTARSLAWRIGHRLAAARATWAEGLLALAMGDHQEAFERIGLVTGSAPDGHPDIARRATADLVESALRCGQVETATEAAADYAAWARGRTAPWVEAHALRCQALLAAYDNDPDADKYAEMSGAASDRLPFEQARIVLFHGEWLRRNRRPTQARQRLRTAVALFDRLGSPQWAEHARTQLRALGGVGEQRPADLAVRLTPQELQVARLAAQGLSNREIGTRLFLSPRTVGYHLYKLFPKLGIASRSQLRHLDLG